MRLEAAARAEIQGLLFTGFPALEHAVYLFLHVRSAALAAIALEGLLPRITTAAGDLQASPAVNIAFSAAGLRTLEVDEEVLSTFSPAFADGMAGAGHRARILGDVHPPAWHWGTEDRPAHIFVLVFANSAPDARHAAATVRAHFGESAEVVAEIEGGFLPPPGVSHQQGRHYHTEHFGFADGLAQPHFDPARPRKPDQVRAGEFIMGYPDEASAITPSGGPVVPLSLERHGLPYTPDRSGWDLGINGSYLVARQMAQHVHVFWNDMLKAAPTLGSGATALDVAEKVVGRRLDGTPLVADLQFKRLDPAGTACPFGSHVRRVNPRDHLDSRQRNRHRLLRRGRTYGPAYQYPEGGPASITRPLPDDGGKRGLLFLALNADIERQFEFIHQNWINHGAFHGLLNERDPLVGSRRDPPSLTIPADPARRRLIGLGEYATVEGGEYFFLPGLTALAYVVKNARAKTVMMEMGV